MHTLWSYGSDKIVRDSICQVHILCAKIQREGNVHYRQAMRLELNTYTEKLTQEQRLLSKYLSEIERDWDRYMDYESRDKYYAELTRIYLLAGGHQAGVQEDDALHELTHQPPINSCPICGYVECVCHQPVPLWQRPEAHSKRGQNKLFKE